MTLPKPGEWERVETEPPYEIYRRPIWWDKQGKAVAYEQKMTNPPERQDDK